MKFTHTDLYMECPHTDLYMECPHTDLYMECTRTDLYMECPHTDLYMECAHTYTCKYGHSGGRAIRVGHACIVKANCIVAACT